MKMSFKTSGVPALEKRLKTSAQLKGVKSLVKQHGAQLQQLTMRNMTSAYTGHRAGNNFVKPTGFTKRSVELTLKDSGLTVEVTVGSSYFPYLEKGTRFMRARPTMKPAFTAVRPKFEAKLKQMFG